MPKYYIQDDTNGWIIDGKDGFSACVKGIYFKIIDSFHINARTGKMDGSYLVSEKGFDDPKGEIISTKKVVKKCLELMG
jgi:hypothetical protein